MSQQMKNFFIGLFFAVAIGLFMSLVLFLKPSIGDEKQTLLVRFSNINKVGVGTQVLFAGKPIGEVTAVHEIYHARETQPSDELGRLFFYQLTLKIDSKVHVYSTDEISIQTSGLLGEKSICITPKAPIKGIIAERITDKIPFYADSVDPIENTFNSLSELGEKLNITVSKVNDLINQNQDDLSKTISALTGASQQVNTLLQSVNEKKIVFHLQNVMNESSSALKNMNKALTLLDQNHVFEQFSQMTANLNEASVSLKETFAHLNSNQGTVGKLISSDDMYLRIASLLSKVDTLMNDVNHYGLLFHLNKGWQRTRTKKAVQLEALQSPAEFKNYFNMEIGQINTCMARLTKLIDKAKEEDKTPVLLTPQFQNDFALLLRQVDQIASDLKSYNEQYRQSLEE